MQISLSKYRTFNCNEKSSFYLDVVLRDIDGTYLSPVDKVEWWLVNPDTEEVLLPKEELSPMSEFRIFVPHTVNVCEEEGKNERRLLIIRVEASPHVHHEGFYYNVVNFTEVPYVS